MLFNVLTIPSVRRSILIVAINFPLTKEMRRIFKENQYYFSPHLELRKLNLRDSFGVSDGKGRKSLISSSERAGARLHFADAVHSFGLGLYKVRIMWHLRRIRDTNPHFRTSICSQNTILGEGIKGNNWKDPRQAHVTLAFSLILIVWVMGTGCTLQMNPSRD
jgi:hypothetical protein